MVIEESKQLFQRLSGKQDMIAETLEKNARRYADLAQLQEDIAAAAAIIQVTAKETQENLRHHIEDIVELALDTCFPDVYSFVLEFETKRGRTEAGMYLVDNGVRIDPMDAAGGGVVDIISFALRIAAWTLSKTDNVIVLDEPFKFLSVNLRPLAGEILKKLTQRLGLQFIMVTHDEAMIDAADRVFEVTQDKGVSAVAQRGT
jgi:hypothetical protein